MKKTEKRLPVLLHKSLGVPKELFKMTPSQRLNALLSRPDAPLLIRRARIEDLHYLIKSIGVADSQEILLYAGPEQIRGLMHIETFKGDEFVPERFISYMDLIEDVSHDKALKVINNMDPEAIALTILKYAEVKVVSEDSDPNDEAMPVMLTPDNVFYLVFKTEEAEGQAEVKRLLDLLYEADMQLAHNVLFMCMYDTYSNIQEELFRTRENLLEETGFPKYDERFEIFANVPVKKIKALVDQAYTHRDHLKFTKEPWADKMPFAIELYDSYHEGMFFDAIMELGDRNPDLLQKVLVDYRYLVDAILRAQFKDMSLDNAWNDAVYMAGAFVSTALDYLGDGDLDKATFVLERFYLKDIFKTGFTLLERLHRRAVKLVREIKAEENLILFGDLIMDTVKALLKKPPRVFKGAIELGKMEEDYPWSYKDIVKVEELVAQAEAVFEFMKEQFDLNIEDIATPEHEITFATVINTMAARAYLYGTADVRPLNEDELKNFINTVLQDEEVFDGLKKIITAQAYSFFKDRPDYARAMKDFVEYSVHILKDQLGGIDTSMPLDKRFLGNALWIEF